MPARKVHPQEDETRPVFLRYMHVCDRDATKRRTKEIICKKYF